MLGTLKRILNIKLKSFNHLAGLNCHIFNVNIRILIAANIIKEEEKMKIATQNLKHLETLNSVIKVNDTHSIKLKDAIQLLEVQRLSVLYQAALNKVGDSGLAALQTYTDVTNIATDMDEIIDLVRDKMSDEQKDVFDSIELQLQALHYKPQHPGTQKEDPASAPLLA
jgi:hypothetical protein